MRHVEDICALIRVLQHNNTFHALVVESPPGWAKSSTIERLLKESGTEFFSLGSYSTPLALYNSICKHPNSLLVLDDCAGLFNEPTAMAILKAASWTSTGSGGNRRITWSSSSEKVQEPSVDFNGKLILLSNGTPAGKEVQAFLTRTLYLRLAFNEDEVKKMLVEATQSIEHYPNQNQADMVVQFILSNSHKYDLRKLNLRTLKMGYEIARNSPDSWSQLFGRLLPPMTPQDVLRSLNESTISVEEQCKEFIKATGLSRRTFYYYKQGKIPRRSEPSLAEICGKEPSANCTNMANPTVSSAAEPLAAPNDYPSSLG